MNFLPASSRSHCAQLGEKGHGQLAERHRDVRGERPTRDTAQAFEVVSLHEQPVLEGARVRQRPAMQRPPGFLEVAAIPVALGGPMIGLVEVDEVHPGVLHRLTRRDQGVLAEGVEALDLLVLDVSGG